MLERALEAGFESFFIDSFIKLNFISFLNNNVSETFYNDAVSNEGRNPDKFFYSKEIIVILNKTLENEDFKQFILVLSSNQCWKKMKQILHLEKYILVILGVRRWQTRPLCPRVRETRR